MQIITVAIAILHANGYSLYMVTLEIKAFENDGTAVELYFMNDSKPAVRIFDTDADKTVGITIYPSLDRAKMAFDEMIAKMIKTGAC